MAIALVGPHTASTGYVGPGGGYVGPGSLTPPVTPDTLYGTLALLSFAAGVLENTSPSAVVSLITNVGGVITVVVAPAGALAAENPLGTITVK